MSYGNETRDSIEGHRSQINLSAWRPLGWTADDERRQIEREERDAAECARRQGTTR